MKSFRRIMCGGGGCSPGRTGLSSSVLDRREATGVSLWRDEELTFRVLDIHLLVGLAGGSIVVIVTIVIVIVLIVVFIVIVLIVILIVSISIPIVVIVIFIVIPIALLAIAFSIVELIVFEAGHHCQRSLSTRRGHCPREADLLGLFLSAIIPELLLHRTVSVERAMRCVRRTSSSSSSSS